MHETLKKKVSANSLTKNSMLIQCYVVQSPMRLFVHASSFYSAYRFTIKKMLKLEKILISNFSNHWSNTSRCDSLIPSPFTYSKWDTTVVTESKLEKEIFRLHGLPFSEMFLLLCGFAHASFSTREFYLWFWTITCRSNDFSLFFKLL